MHRRIFLVTIAMILASVAHVPPLASGQDQVFLEWDVFPEGDYADGNNWFNPEGGGGPPNVDFDEIGVIFNGGTAVVSSPVATAAGGVVLGELANETGHLLIEAGGELTVAGLFVDEVGNKTSTNVGATLGGTGTLTVEEGGTLNTEGLFSNLDPANLITLGGTNGGDPAVVIANQATLRGTTRIVGDNVEFVTNGRLSLLNGHTLIAEFAGNQIAELAATGQVALFGTLDAQFDAAPAVGDRWTLVDAPTITGTFDNVASNQELGVGQALAVRTSAGGDNGQIAQLVVEQHLIVNANWTNGEVTIENPGEAEVRFDGYRLRSPNGNLVPANWTPLQNNPATPGWDATAPPGGIPDGDYNRNGTTDAPDFTLWRDTFGSETMLDADGNRNGIIDAPDYNVWRDNFGAIGSGDGTDLVELNPLDALSLTAADGPVSIGNLFDNSALPFAADFTLREDLELEYTSPGVGSIDVTVNYIGERPATTLELIVDPDSGQARLLNPTTSVVDMDAYTILSASGSIDANLATGLGPDWDTAPLSDEFGFTQLNPESSLVLASGEAAELGQLFAAGDADPDLAMTFLTVPGSGLPPGPVDALVVYQSLAGATNAQSLPEPTTLLLAIAAHALLAMVRHRNSS